MEDQNTKIANLQLFISDNCSEKDKEIINFYWKFKDTEFLNTPKQVRDTFAISQSVMRNIIETYSELSFYKHCESCNSYAKLKAFSITNYFVINHIKQKKNSICKRFKCDHCQQEECDEYTKELILKQENAIKSKNWNNLNNFERQVLLSSLEMYFTELSKKYWSQLGEESFNILIKALEKIANENLILLFRNGPNNYIYAYEHLSYLREFKDEIKAPKKIKSSYVQTDVDTNELKFKLTINENQYHPDSPLHAGTVTFKERIVIEPGVEYIFGLWNRANENLYLTMTPLENLEKTPQTKRINSQPKSIRQVMIDYLNSLGADS